MDRSLLFYLALTEKRLKNSRKDGFSYFGLLQLPSFLQEKKVDILCTWVHGTSVCQPSSCGFPLHRNIFSGELLVVRSRMVAQFLAIRTNYHCYGIIFQTWMCHLGAMVRNVDAAVFIFLLILNSPYSNYQGIHALGNTKSFNSSVKCRLQIHRMHQTTPVLEESFAFAFHN